jgi:hypothetical protein
MRNEREPKGGHPLAVRRVTLGDPVTLSACDPACITRTAPRTGGPETSTKYERPMRFVRAKDSLRRSGSLQYRAVVTTQLCKRAGARQGKACSKFDSSGRAALNANGLWFPATIGSRV